MIHHLLSATLLLCSVVVAQGPVIGLWPLDETSGMTTADLGPHANVGTLINFTNDPAQWVPGVSGNALDFDGVDDYVDLQMNGGLPFYNGLGDTFSICMWVNGSPTEDDRVLSLSSVISNTPLFTIGTGRITLGNADRLQIFVRNDSGANFSRYSDATAFDNTWHHIAYVESSGQARVYIDGVRDTANFDDRFGSRGTRSSNHGTYTFDKATLGGILRSSTCCHYQGMIDSVQMYAFALTEADVNIVMGGGTPSVCRASVGEYGVGCGPGPLDLYAAGHPAIGSAGFLFSMRGGSPNAAALLGIGVGRVSPLDLAAFGFVHCTLYPPSPTFLGVGVLDQFGSSGSIPLPIPNVPALACITVVFQGVGVSAAGVEFSSAIVAVLGN